jgi:hypothetical protein
VPFGDRGIQRMNSSQLSIAWNSAILHLQLWIGKQNRKGQT